METWQKIVIVVIAIAIFLLLLPILLGWIGNSILDAIFKPLLDWLNQYYSLESIQTAVETAGNQTTSAIGVFHEWATTYIYTPLAQASSDLYTTVGLPLYNTLFGWWLNPLLEPFRINP